MPRYEFSHWLFMYYSVFGMNMGDGAECKTCIGVPEWFQMGFKKSFFSSRKGCRSSAVVSFVSCSCYHERIPLSKEEKWAGSGWSQVAVEGKARFCKKAFHARKISGRSYNLFWIVGRIHGIAATSWPPPGLTGFLSTTLLPQICASRLTFFTQENIWRNSISVADCTCPSWSIMTNSHRNCHQAFLHQSSVFITLAISNALSCLTASCIVYLPDSKRKPMDEYKKGLWQNKDGQNCDNFVKQRQRQKVFSTKHGWPALWQLYQSGEFDSCGAY